MLSGSNVLVELAVDQKCVKIASLKVNDKATPAEMDNAINNSVYMLLELSHRLKEADFPVAPLSSTVDTTEQSDTTVKKPARGKKSGD